MSEQVSVDNIKIGELKAGDKHVWTEGEVTEVKREGITKTGKKYKLVTLKDDTGQCQFFVFEDMKVSDVWGKWVTPFLDGINVGMRISVLDAYCKDVYEGIPQLRWGDDFRDAKEKPFKLMVH